MEIYVLGSGSTGNCTYVAAGGTRLLVDAGLGYKDTLARLAELSTTLDSVSGVIITHDHCDHSRSASAIRRRHKVPLFANEGTVASIELSDSYKPVDWNIFECNSPFNIGHLQVGAFSVPHDAADTVGFVLTDGNARLGVATDVGVVTHRVKEKLADCNALILETNHDPEMLFQSGRHRSMITRIFGPKGHLCNEDAADLLSQVLCPRLQTVFLAHRSPDCNTPFLAESAFRAVLKKAGREDISLIHTYAEAVSERIEI